MLNTATKTALMDVHQFEKLTAHIAAMLKHTPCGHTFYFSARWMQRHRCDVRANLERMVDWHIQCDCELIDDIEKERWRDRREEPLTGPNIHGMEKWQAAIDDFIRETNK